MSAADDRPVEGTNRRTVFDAPDEVFVVGWTWKRGNGSGGSREVFVSWRACETKVRLLYADSDTEVNDIKVWRLGSSEWWPMDVHAPTEASIQSTEGDDE